MYLQMASCEVEPLDLSMDHNVVHEVYEKHFEGMMTSGVMKKKVEALAKDMSHFTYKDLWTECCRRYKDIVKKLLGYEAYSRIQETSELNSVEHLPESDIARRCRKRRASGESTDSGRSDDFTLPLKKRHLRNDYSNEFDTTEQQPSDDDDPLDLGPKPNNRLQQQHKSSQYSNGTVEQVPIVGPFNLGPKGNNISSHKDTNQYCNSAVVGQSPDSIDTSSSERRPTRKTVTPPDDECIIVCPTDDRSGDKESSSSPYQDEPCDLRTYSINITPPTTVNTTAIPSLAKYDNATETSDKSEEARRLGLLARLLSEPKSTGENPQKQGTRAGDSRRGVRQRQPWKKKIISSNNNTKSTDGSDNDDSCVVVEPDCVVVCETYRGSARKGPGTGPRGRGGVSKPDLYASPYLNTSTNRGQYSEPATRGHHPSSSLFSASQSENTRKQFSQRTVNIFHIPPLPTLPSFRKRRTDSTKVIARGQGHPAVNLSSDKAPSVVNSKESRRDKILKRLLEYEDCKSGDVSKNRSLATEWKTNWNSTTAKPCKTIRVKNGFGKNSKFGDKTFWDFIKEACDQVAKMDQVLQ